MQPAITAIDNCELIQPRPFWNDFKLLSWPSFTCACGSQRHYDTKTHRSHAIKLIQQNTSHAGPIKPSPSQSS